MTQALNIWGTPLKKTKMLKKGKRTHRKKWDDSRETYDIRAINLKTLGFDSYQQYLASELWESIRTRVLDRDKHVCRLCDSRRATQVHHRDYGFTTLSGEHIGGVIAVCYPCHRHVEFSRGEKRTGKRAARITENMMCKPVDALTSEFDAICAPTPHSTH